MYAVSATGWYESNMVWTHLKWFFIVSSLTVVSGNVKCSEAVNGQSLTCQCVTDNSIDWIKDGTLISGCSSAFCIPSSLNGETFNPITNGYEIVITTFNDSYCGEYSCVDNVATTSYSFPTCKVPTTTASPTTTTASHTTNKPEPNLPGIIGGAVGGVSVLIAAVIVVILYLRCRTNKKKTDQTEMKNNSQTFAN